MQVKTLFRQAFRLFFLLLLTNSIGYLASAYMTPETLDWYRALPMSDLTPPDFIFGLVWVILFFLMSISAFLVWGKVTPRWFVLQLMLNMLWSFSFFYMKMPALALVALVVMLFFIYKTLVSFGRVSKLSACLLIPLFLWSIFALYLNFVIVKNLTKF